MTDRSESHPTDESALANDLIRLLGGENQRLKRELQEAEQRARDAEKRAQAAGAKMAVKNEHTDASSDLAAAQRIQQLQEENENLRAHQQELESKYSAEKEKRKTLKSELKEAKAKGTNAELTQAHLTNAELKIKELSQQAEQLARDKEMYTKLYEDASGRASMLTRNDPLAYIEDVYIQRQFAALAVLKPFQTDNSAARSSFDQFCNNTLKPRGLACLPFAHRRHNIHWCPRQQGYGFAIEPPYRYVTNRLPTAHEWIPNEMQVIEGPFELLYEARGFWYYCGTYTTTFIQSRNKDLFQELGPKAKEHLMRESVEKTDLLPPIVGKMIMQMYLQGFLHVNCLVFERIGFNKQLNDALLGFGRDVKGPDYSFDSKAPKRKIGQETDKKARVTNKRPRKPSKP